MAAHTSPPVSGALRVATPYVRPEARRLTLAAVCSCLEVACQLLAPWPLALAVDHALGGLPLEGPAEVLSGLGTTGLLIVAGAATVLITAASGLLDLSADVNATKAAERMGLAIRRDVFRRALALSLRWHDRMRTGELVSRLTVDTERLLGAIVATITMVLPDLLLLVGALVLLFAVDPTLAWLGLVVLPVLAWLTAGMRQRLRRVNLEAREASGALSGLVTDLLRNVRAVQAFGQHDRAVHMFDRPNARIVDAEVRAVTVESRWALVPEVVLAVGTGIVLVAGGMQVVDGALTTGQLLVVLAYLGNLQNPVQSMVTLSGIRAKAAASAQRIREVLDCTEAVPTPSSPRPVPPVREGIRLESVSFSYTPRRPVLDGFDLTLSAGETVCLFGPSGAGKSTVLSLLLRLYDPDGGRVLLDGIDVREFAPVDLRRRLAFVPQDPWLLDATIAENIALGKENATRAEVLAAGRAAWVDEFALSLPEGYDTPLGESGLLLSGGQRRRVALARAVISTAPVVQLDEPTTSLDAEAAAQVVGAILSATRDRTVLLVTHDPALAAVADRTVAVTPLLRPSPAVEDDDDFGDEDFADEDFGDDFERGDTPRLVTPDAARAGGAPVPIPGTEHSVVRAGARATKEGRGGDVT